MCLPARIACPVKKAAKLATRETANETAANNSALAAYSTPRRGITASEVRIIPVEYSEVITSAPRTTMISSPSATCPIRLERAALKSACAAAGCCDQCATVPAQARIAHATLATTCASSVQ